MKKMIIRMISALMALCLLATCGIVQTEVNAASEFYGSYSDVSKVYDYGDCAIMQGLAVGSQKMYTVKINSDDSLAFISMTDKDTGETVKMYNSDAGSYYFDYLGHANDMDVTSFDGKSHLFIATMKKGSNAIVRLKRSGTNLTKVASYSLTYNGSSVSCSAIAIKSVSNDVITFITKVGTNVYTGSVSASATSANIELSLLCMISKSKVYIKDQYYDLSSFVNQGMGYHNGVLYVPISGGSGWLHRSVIMVFNLDDVIPGSTIYPSEAIAFRVTSSSYSAQFEIESCCICSSDGKLYFNTNRCKSSTDKDHDGVSWFKDYTFVKLTEPCKYQNFVVQYDANGGTGTMENTTVPYGVTTNLSANTYTRQGYNFAGWTAYRSNQAQWYYTDGTTKGWYTEGSQPSGYEKYIYKDQQGVAKTSAVDGDTVIMYAQWTPITYTVRYDVNGGSGTMADSIVTYGVSSALRTNTFTREGYTFAGWVAYRTAKNQWRYANPEGTGSGWYIEGSQPEGYTLYVYADGAKVSKTTSVDGDVTVFYAQWSPNPYTITFKDADGTVLQSSTFVTGTLPTAPSDPTKEQDGCTVYTFAGWDREITTVTGDATYTATYTDQIVHSWNEATCGEIKTCSVCGTTDGDVLEHNYQKTTTAPTCTEGGKVVYTCANCGDSYTETIAAFGHSYGTTVTAPTCTVGGYTTYTCGFCGDSYVSDQVAATGHSYVSGICGTCGETDPDYAEPVMVPTMGITSAALNFEAEIMYNIYFTATDMTDVVEMGLITFDTKLTDGTIDNAVTVVPGYYQSGSEYVVHTNGIPAKNLGDAVYFKAYAKLSDGSYAYSGVAGYHAVLYAQDILANSTSQKMKNLVIAMLNYGAAAQTHFDYKTESLMNAILTDAQKASINGYSADMADSLTAADNSKLGNFTKTGGFTGLSPSVAFEGAFAINFYLTTANAMDGDLTFYYWRLDDYTAADVLTADNASGVVTATATSNGEYLAVVEGIAAKEIDQTVYISAVYESNGVRYCTGVIAYSLATYCKDMISMGAATMQTFAAETIVYGYYAKQYFA